MKVLVRVQYRSILVRVVYVRTGIYVLSTYVPVLELWRYIVLAVLATYRKYLYGTRTYVQVYTVQYSYGTEYSVYTGTCTEHGVLLVLGYWAIVVLSARYRYGVRNEYRNESMTRVRNKSLLSLLQYM